jgi:hypothetical protein
VEAQSEPVQDTIDAAVVPILADFPADVAPAPSAYNVTFVPAGPEVGEKESMITPNCLG